MTKGYHYIRYAALGIYLLFLHKAIDWVAAGVLPLQAVKWYGVFITIMFTTVDGRNYVLWRKEVSREGSSPGWPWVSWFVLLLYGSCLFWFWFLPSSTRNDFLYPYSIDAVIDFQKEYIRLRQEKVDLAQHAATIAGLEETTKREREAFEKDKYEFENGLVERKKELSAIEQDLDRIRAEFARENETLQRRRTALKDAKRAFQAREVELERQVEKLSKDEEDHLRKRERFDVEKSKLETMYKELKQEQTSFLSERQALDLAKAELEKERESISIEGPKLKEGISDFERTLERYGELREEHRQARAELQRDDEILSQRKIELEVRRKRLNWDERVARLAEAGIIIVAVILVIHFVTFISRKVFG